MEEGQLAVGLDHQQAVRLGHRAGHLGEELRPRDSYRDWEPHLLAHCSPQGDRDLHGSPADVTHAAHVQECLVDRQPLHKRSSPLEDPKDGLAGIAVGGKPGRHDDRTRTQPARLRSSHRRAEAARFRLIARRQHHTATDNHRSAPEAGIVPLLNRRVEGVQVRMQSHGLVRHEHMFDSGSCEVKFRGSGVGLAGPVAGDPSRPSQRCAALRARWTDRGTGWEPRRDRSL
jgi:hypothetical protein